MHDPYGGFEYVAREARRELLEEARNRRLVRLARPDLGFRERLARLLSGLRDMVRPRAADDGEVAVGGEPDAVYVLRESPEEAGITVEVFLGADGCVVRKIDLSTGANTSSFLTERRVRR